MSVGGDDIYLNSRQATSLALAVNELLQNAVEHAFPERPAGHVEIRLAQRDAGLILEVEDDGRGIPAGFDPLTGDELGLKIVHALVTEDLGGTLTFAAGGGTKAVITVPKLDTRYA